MDDLFLYLSATVLVGGPLFIFFISKKPIFDKVLGSVGYVWVMGFALFGNALGLSGIKWLAAVFPGFCIMIYFKYREIKNKKI